MNDHLLHYLLFSSSMIVTSLISKHFANPACCHVILELGQTQRKLMLANISLKCETVSLQCTAMSAAAVSLFWSCVPGSKSFT